MSSKSQFLGERPGCGAEIPAGAVFVKDAGLVVYAECPACVEPVHPS